MGGRSGQDEGSVGRLVGRQVARCLQRGDDSGGVGMGHEDRGRDRAEAELAGEPGLRHLGQQGRILAADVAGGRSHPHVAEPAAQVVHQVGEGLGDAPGGVVLEEPEDVGGGAPGIEGPAERRFAEPVDGGRPLRLDVAEEGELGPDRGGRLTGDDRGQVGLDHEVGDRRRDQHGQRRRRIPPLAGHEHPSCGGERALSGDAEQLRLVDRP
ncbi:MAG: hypothetical protein AVDCRST_MAG10-2771 [uncultured Acidimicrobiales bacterium]|uniref:Uncharacterized protein n=1 Tax=uncultured Acidimicrobiales bacterium TaxID=310071 RepID=A0A6J4IVJ5_9ACTN|nr:MAG: hypothetical protein AVDCRST_MAG10-2771 [uncultured Acidimicrobiales bacterium]